VKWDNKVKEYKAKRLDASLHRFEKEKNSEIQQIIKNKKKKNNKYKRKVHNAIQRQNHEKIEKVNYGIEEAKKFTQYSTIDFEI